MKNVVTKLVLGMIEKLQIHYEIILHLKAYQSWKNFPVEMFTSFIMINYELELNSED